MTAEKQKRQHSLPNRQLAQVFQFSASDLAANRNGFITKAQLWSIPLWLRGTMHRLVDWSPLRNWFSSERNRVEMICGRAILRYEQMQIQSIFHADIVEVYKFSINSIEFRISPKQHYAIGEGVVYRLYYNPDNKQILSLERAINGCSES